MKGSKIVYVCRECGTTSPKWLGKCPECESWNTFDEELVNKDATKEKSKLESKNKAELFSEIEITEQIRVKS